jgi:hypothetical protein
MKAKTIIVGGGMAGMSCAMKLLETNQEFLLVADDLGGRIKYSAETKVNFGAYFVMSSYTNAKKLLMKGIRINPIDACFHNSNAERFSLLSLHTLSRLPELFRFYFVLQKFSAHYGKFKQRCLTMSQKAALEANPYMASLFTKPASQFIREEKFEKVAFDFVSKFAYACTGAGVEQITALDFLNVSMGMIIPIHTVIFDPQAVSKKLGDHLVFDSILRVEKRAGENLLTGKSGEIYQAENVVIATPASITQKLLGLKEIREASKIYVYHVRAELKPAYRKYGLNLFPYTSEIMLTARQLDGSYLIYAREKSADLHLVCDQFELLSTMVWEKAMYVKGKAFMEQEYGSGIYVAGDHNGLGLEPAAISGIYAANQIINRKE